MDTKLDIRIHSLLVSLLAWHSRYITVCAYMKPLPLFLRHIWRSSKLSKPYLPTTFIVRGKVMFSLVCVILCNGGEEWGEGRVHPVLVLSGQVLPGPVHGGVGGGIRLYPIKIPSGQVLSMGDLELGHILLRSCLGRCCADPLQRGIDSLQSPHHG